MTLIQGFATDAQKWDALVQRDRNAADAFVYAVQTTGIYCRPACPSRLPKQPHVVFFQTCAAAVEAGFRPCKRCRPDAIAPQVQQAALITRLCKLMEASDTLSLDELAIARGLSPYYLQRLFKATVGVTPKAYAIAQRAQRVRDSLQQGDSVTQAIYDAGFETSSRFYAGATEILGMTPSQYKAGANNLTIQFAVEPSFLGWVLVAATERGICAIDLGDDPDTLTAQLRTRFPNAQLRAEPTFATWVAQVMALIETPDRGLTLPLAIQGTAFQQRVWRSLQTIPPGTTVSYGELAKQLGSPSAVRAVAGACAANTIAVAIPCHRVVRSNGALSGYRWGIERKRLLLEREAALQITAKVES